MRTLARWAGYIVCWIGAVILFAWLGFAVYGILVVNGWV